MTRAVTLALATALVIPFTARAQPKPDFSGTWTLDSARSDAPPLGRGGRGGGGGTATQVIKQTATELNVEITVGGGGRKAVFKLDGSETTNEGGRGGIVTSKARWDGPKLVIESHREVQGFSITTKEVRSLEAGGKEMVVETTADTPQGAQTFKQVFTKS